MNDVEECSSVGLLERVGGGGGNQSPIGKMEGTLDTNRPVVQWKKKRRADRPNAGLLGRGDRQGTVRALMTSI